MVAAFTLILATTLMAPQNPGVHQRVLQLDANSQLHYALSMPVGYEENKPVPLIVALHFGWGDGSAPPNIGRGYMEILVLPALRPMGAIIVAPDCPASSWANPDSAATVKELVDVMQIEFAIDPDRILITGFSLGGMGTWYLASRYPDLFTAAIPMASTPIIAAVEDDDRPQRFTGAGSIEWPDGMLTMPIFALHGEEDELIRSGPLEEAISELREQGAPAEMMLISGLTHHETMRYVPYLASMVEWLRAVWGS